MLTPRYLSDEDLPGFWKDGDQSSQDGQRWTVRYLCFKLVGSLIAAVGGVLSLKAGEVDVAAVVILIGFILALTSELASWVHQPEKIWHRGRAMAETAKSLAWRYSIGAEPFPSSMPRNEASRLLRERMKEVTSEISDLVVLESDNPLITPGMDALRESSFEERRAAYIVGRVQDQQKWYAEKAKQNRRYAATWRIALISAEVLAVVLASLRVFGNWNVDLAGLLAAVIAAGAAWVAIKQFSPLAAAYSVASRELLTQTPQLESVPEDEWPLEAKNAEEAISREHNLWLAARIGKHGTK